MKERYTDFKQVSQENKQPKDDRRDHTLDDYQLPHGTHSYRLEDLAYTRSGDKGNTCNIG